MAFGLQRAELVEWKKRVAAGEIAYMTHYWLEARWPDSTTVTKVGCADLGKLSRWCRSNGLNPEYIHARDDYPHYDLIGSKQREILAREGLWEQIERFGL
ncbi:hypothetical protein BG53_07230 [Paenibacillus darwinianus]|uniref:YneQ n=1 Tax=Paenibacillus darwinianus TaxID=1380763 RepID=A0A9W5RZX6_9BACL|nr:hypothetical protein [Paenibacillus darwinianus]EXX85783.1 hypothetical protein CH50_08805 [Paenibacillus darwinianus]EXX85946.1 hypothetical protein BG53_07230 [Paenibacillus darwinianus]EXX88654.1 hypothetical protein BG52_01465 [Paenibacillus darwinianus]